MTRCLVVLACLSLAAAPAYADFDSNLSSDGQLTAHGTTFGPPDSAREPETRGAENADFGRTAVVRREIVPVSKASSGSLEGLCLLKSAPQPPRLPFGFEYNVIYYQAAGEI